jgi:hypothetical protein
METRGRRAGYKHSVETREKIAEGKRRAHAAKVGGEVPEGNAWCSGHQCYHPVAEFGVTKSKKSGLQSNCKQWHRDYYAANKPEFIRRNQDDSTRRLYGLALDEIEARIEAQGNTCAICHGPPNGQGRLHVDHSHVTGQNRAMLDFTCNSDLGRLEKWIDSGWLVDAVKYLVEWGSLTDDEVAALASALH